MGEEASKILMSAPPGQFHSVLQDIIALNSGSGPDTIAAKAQYDASTGRYFIDASEEVNNHPLAAALKEQFNSYKDKFYSTKGLSVGVRVESKGNTLLVSMYTEGLDEANCHSGSWFSQWRIQAEGNSEALISGKVTLHACSYEGNNVQLHTVMDFGEVNVTAKGNDISESLIAQISMWETEVMDSCQRLHDDMSDKLKSLRRVLPVTRTRMDWNVVTHRMVKILGETLH